MIRARSLPVFWCLLHLVTLLGASSCAVNPVSRRPELVLTTSEGEREIGREEARKIEQSMGFVGSPELLAYVSEIGDRLAAQAPRRDVGYSVRVIDMETPNALALPGGYVYVSRGLLALANTEDELAAVIGHEIGHVAARHAVQQQTQGLLTTPLTLATGIAGGAASIVAPGLGGALAGIGQLAGGLVHARYSREQEREADRIGLELAAKAGWDPSAMSGFLHTLEREERLVTGRVRGTSFLDTHPSTPERVASTRAHAATLRRAESQPISPSRAAFLTRIEGILVGQDPAKGVFDGDEFLHPVLGFALRFPSGWNRQNAPAYVAAAAPDGSALAVLEAVGRGDDPLKAAGADRKLVGFDLADVERTTVGGLPAARVTTQLSSGRARFGVEITWVHHAGRIHRISGLAPAAKFAAYRSPLREIADGFRPLTPADRDRITEARLRIVEARAGETLARLLDRHNSAWGPAEAEVANALERNAVLDSGQLVKVPVPRRYPSP